MTFDQVYRHLWYAYLKTLAGKRGKNSCLSFEMDADIRVSRLARQLHKRSYVPGPAMCFVHQESVKREIFASTLEHRIVCTLLFEYLNPLYQRLLIYDTYSSQTGKGQFMGISRFKHHIASVTENYTKQAYVLKLDLKSFFVSIDKSILHRILTEDLDAHWSFYKKSDGCWFGNELATEREWLNYLLTVVIFRDPTDKCMFLGTEEERASIPLEKSLFSSPPGVGLALGDLTSQLFSNVYLGRFDNYVKRILKIKHYGRYVDDFFLMHNDAVYLKSLLPKVRSFLKDELHLTIHPKKIIFQPCSYGVMFLGAYCKPNVTYASKRLAKSFRQKVIEFEYDARKSCVKPERLYVMRSVLNSYCGYLKHYSSYNIKKGVFQSCEYLWKYFYFSGGYSKAILRSNFKSRI